MKLEAADEPSSNWVSSKEADSKKGKETQSAKTFSVCMLSMNDDPSHLTEFAEAVPIWRD